MRRRKGKNKFGIIGFFVSIVFLWLVSLASFYFSDSDNESVSASSSVSTENYNFSSRSKWKIRKEFEDTEKKIIFAANGIAKHSVEIFSSPEDEKLNLVKTWYPSGMLKESRLLDKKEETRERVSYLPNGLEQGSENVTPFLLVPMKLGKLVTGVKSTITQNIKSLTGDSLYESFADGKFSSKDSYGNILSEFSIYRGYITGQVVGVKEKFNAFYNNGILNGKFRASIILPAPLRVKSNSGYEKGYIKNGVLDGEFSISPDSGVADLDNPDKNSILKLTLKNGVLNGEAFIRTSGGFHESKNFKDNVISGVQTIKNGNGKNFFIANYTDGILNGSVKEWYDNGKVKIKGAYKNGLKSGVFNLYNKKGATRAKLKFSNGRLSGNQVLYSSGRTLVKVNYKSGSPNGPFTIFHSNGRARIVGRYKSGLLEGSRSEFDKKGNLIRKAVFSKGVLDKPIEEYYLNGRLKGLITADNVNVRIDHLFQGLDFGYAGQVASKK